MRFFIKKLFCISQKTYANNFYMDLGEPGIIEIVESDINQYGKGLYVFIHYFNK